MAKMKMIRSRDRSGRQPKRSDDGDGVNLTFELPPSTNALYQTLRGGGKALTDVAKAYREGVYEVVTGQLHQLHIPTDQETVFRFSLRLYFEALENPGWFEFWKEDKFYTKDIKFKSGPRKGQVQFEKGELKVRAGERKAKSRYKKLDVDNRVKFLQDCVVKALGIPDDSQVFRGSQEKHEDPDNPRAEVQVRVTDRDRFFRRKR